MPGLMGDGLPPVRQAGGSWTMPAAARRER
jgi:hypothetical protein